MQYAFTQWDGITEGSWTEKCYYVTWIFKISLVCLIANIIWQAKNGSR